MTIKTYTLALLVSTSLFFKGCGKNTETDTQTNTMSPTQSTSPNTTQTSADINGLKSLKLIVEKTTLNKDENTTVKVTAQYEDGSSKDVTDKVEWITIPKGAVSVIQKTLIAIKDVPTILNAKLGTVVSNTINLDIAWIVNGHKLPPEPDLTVNKSTLLGIDVNDNGVRDDVERWIYKTYKDKHPIYIDIAMQAARGYKLVLETPERAKEIYLDVDKAIDCQAYYKYSAKYYNEPILLQENAVDEYFRSKIYFNTNERMHAYDEYDTLLSGDSYSLPTDQERKQACDFNTSNY